MSTVNSFDKNLHFAELNSPLFTGNPTPMTPAARKAAALANLGALAASGAAGSFTTLTASGQATFGDVLMTKQPRVTQPAATAVNTSATVTGANIIDGVFTSTAAAAVAMTLPLATAMETAMDAAYGTLAVNDSIEFAVINTGSTAFAVTVTTNTGWTLVGNMAVGGASVPASGYFMIQRNSATTYTCFRLS
jgi:hypothetical protein